MRLALRALARQFGVGSRSQQQKPLPPHQRPVWRFNSGPGSPAVPAASRAALPPSAATHALPQRDLPDQPPAVGPAPQPQPQPASQPADAPAVTPGPTAAAPMTTSTTGADPRPASTAAAAPGRPRGSRKAAAAAADPAQPTLQQVFARAAAAKLPADVVDAGAGSGRAAMPPYAGVSAAAARVAAAADPTVSDRTAAPDQSRPPGRPKAAPASAAAGRGGGGGGGDTRCEAIDLTAADDDVAPHRGGGGGGDALGGGGSRLAAPLQQPAPPDSPWSWEREVVSLRSPVAGRRTGAAAAPPTAAVPAAAAAGPAVRFLAGDPGLGPDLHAALPPAPLALHTAAPTAQHDRPRPSAVGGSGAAALAPAPRAAQWSDAEALAEGLSHLQLAPSPAGAAKRRPRVQPAAAAAAASTASDVRPYSGGSVGAAAAAPLPPVRQVLLGPESQAAPAAAAVGDAQPEPGLEGSAPPRRRGRPRSAAAALAPPEEAADGSAAAALDAAAAAAAAPAKKRGVAAGGKGRAKAKPKEHAGLGPGGCPLWREVVEEERGAGGSLIRWEPLPPAAPPPSGPVQFRLFSVDIETVDFMRARAGGRQAFPQQHQMRLVEVAAVDLGLYGEPYDMAAVAAGGGGGGGGGHVFCSLVNCGKSFRDEKTAAHNGITWRESSAPGVPHTAEALHRFFAFIRSRCSAPAPSSSSSGPPSSSSSAAPAPPCPSSAAAGGAPAAAPAATVVPLLMAHNGAGFDFRVLRHECGRVGVEWPQDWWYLDTLLVSKILWRKPLWPCLPPGEEDEGGEGEGEAEEGEDEAPAPALPKAAAKASLSMAALKHWAGVVSDGQAHRASVDALDLAGVWLALYEQFGRPSPQQLEWLRQKSGAMTAAAGPLHGLGLISLSARTEGLLRHANSAVLRQPDLRRALRLPPPTPPTPVAAAPPLRGGAEAAAGPAAGAEAGAGPEAEQPVVVLPVAEVLALAAGGGVHLRPARGSGGGGGDFHMFEAVRARPAAAAGAAAGAPALEPFVVLLRGVKLGAVWGKKRSTKPNLEWDLHLAPSTGSGGKRAAGARAARGGSGGGAAQEAAAEGGGGSGGEGVCGAGELQQLGELMDGLARQAAVLAFGDSGARASLQSVSKSYAQKGASAPQLKVEVDAQPLAGAGSHSQGTQSWEVRATLASYDKPTASYKPTAWPPMLPYIPDGAGGAAEAAGARQAIREQNLDRLPGFLPSVASSEVLDVAVWPRLFWVNASGCGAKLTALHVVRRPKS